MNNISFDYNDCHFNMNYKEIDIELWFIDLRITGKFKPFAIRGNSQESPEKVVKYFCNFIDLLNS